MVYYFVNCKEDATKFKYSSGRNLSFILASQNLLLKNRFVCRRRKPDHAIHLKIWWLTGRVPVFCSVGHEIESRLGRHLSRCLDCFLPNQLQHWLEIAGTLNTEHFIFIKLTS